MPDQETAHRYKGAEGDEAYFRKTCGSAEISAEWSLPQKEEEKIKLVKRPQS